MTDTAMLAKILAELERRAKYFERLFKIEPTGFNLGASSNLRAMSLWAHKKVHRERKRAIT